MFELANLTYKAARRLVIAVVGGTVLLIGIAMLVLPGPAMVVIPVGLAILGLEFAWARRFLATFKEKGTQAIGGVGALWRRHRGGSAPSAPVAPARPHAPDPDADSDPGSERH
jgi:tellurite resistance protein TerC